MISKIRQKWGLALILCYSSTVFGLNEELAKEKNCSAMDTDDVSLDYTWLLSNQDWFFPMQSKLDLYRTSWDILQKSPADITEEELKSSCIRAVWEGFSPLLVGFNGKELNYEFAPMDDNTFIFTASWRDGDGGKMYLTKTDNKSYIVFVKCWDDGQMTWNAMSSVKSLEPEAKAEIIEYIKSIGFQEFNIIEEDYKNCVIPTAKSEL